MCVCALFSPRGVCTATYRYASAYGAINRLQAKLHADSMINLQDAMGSMLGGKELPPMPENLTRAEGRWRALVEKVLMAPDDLLQKNVPRARRGSYVSRKRRVSLTG